MLQIAPTSVTTYSWRCGLGHGLVWGSGTPGFMSGGEDNHGAFDPPVVKTKMTMCNGGA